MKFFRHKGRKLMSVFKKSGQKFRPVRNILDAHQKYFLKEKFISWNCSEKWTRTEKKLVHQQVKIKSHKAIQRPG